jgi:transcriptional regulator with XRE-family HTH domain
MRDVLNEIERTIPSSGEMAKALRKKLELTQEEVATLTSLQRENISALENGRLEMSVHYAKIFSAVYGVSPVTLLFPDGKFEKSKEIRDIERRTREFMKKRKARHQG